MTSFSSVQEQVKGQIAKCKWQSPSKEPDCSDKSFLVLYFCLLRFAFCLLTCSSLLQEVKMQSVNGKAMEGFTFAFCTLRFAF